MPRGITRALSWPYNPVDGLMTAQDAPAAPASGESRGGIGVMGNGLSVSFPPLPTQDSPCSRPQPSQCCSSFHGILGAGGDTSAVDDVAVASEAGCEGEPAVDGGELFAGSSGSAFDVGCTTYLGGTGASSTARGEATGLPRDRFGEAEQVHLLVPRFQQL